MDTTSKYNNYKNGLIVSNDLKEHTSEMDRIIGKTAEITVEEAYGLVFTSHLHCLMLMVQIVILPLKGS